MKAIWDGQTLAAVCRDQKVHRHSLEHWLDLYLYQLFHQFGLSHQRAHRDYGPSSPAKHADFVADLKKTAELPPDGAVVALDEFSLQSVPDTHSAWAPKNTAPTVRSDERNRKKLNGFLSVDLQRGTTQVDFRAQSKTHDWADLRNINLAFLHTPAYSPAFNPAE